VSCGPGPGGSLARQVAAVFGRGAFAGRGARPSYPG
jgi:hypothetical protein